MQRRTEIPDLHTLGVILGVVGSGAEEGGWSDQVSAQQPTSVRR